MRRPDLYQQRRQEIYQPLQEEGTFTWDAMYGEEYALATIKTFPESFFAEIREASYELGKIFSKVAQVVQQGSDELLKDLGLPSETWSTVRLRIDPVIPTIMGRFDFAYTSKGLKMLEFNSDTPSGVVEAYHVNQKVCEYFGLKNPNDACQRHIYTAFQQIIQQYQRLGFQTDQIYFASLGWHIEDAGTTKYVMKQSGLHSSFIPLSQLVISHDRLYAVNKENERKPIDVLFRLHPLEIMANDKDKQGNPTGAYLLHLIANRKVAIINPPNAFIAQTKALQALIWNLHEQGGFFTQAEHEAVRTWMLPTYLDNPFQGKSAYVRKPFFGREGGAVTLYDQAGQPIDQDRNTNYWDQPMIYQELAELETIDVPTLKGVFTGKLLWGAFLIGGEASAILARVDRNITGDMSYLLPIGYE